MSSSGSTYMIFFQVYDSIFQKPCFLLILLIKSGKHKKCNFKHKNNFNDSYNVVTIHTLLYKQPFFLRIAIYGTPPLTLYNDNRIVPNK